MDNKQKRIIAMFDLIANRYDLANKILSLGIDSTWRNKACKLALQNISFADELCIADIACGTGDMIMHWEKNAQSLAIPLSKIQGIDPSKGMLEIAQKKLPHIEFLCSVATNLPLENESCHLLSIAYGIRNVIERQKAFSEFGRVCKANGILVILEFTKCENPNWLDRLMGFYTNNILPLLGGFISQNYQAYRYLPDSIQSFLTPKMLQSELQAAGFEPFYTKSFLGHICTLILAKKTPL